MSVWVRIAIYLAAGWAFNSGYISDEVKRMITDDPEVAANVQMAISAVLAGASVLWWRFAKRFGWST